MKQFQIKVPKGEIAPVLKDVKPIRMPRYYKRRFKEIKKELV